MSFEPADEIAILEEAAANDDLITHFDDPEDACELGLWHTGPCVD